MLSLVKLIKWKLFDIGVLLLYLTMILFVSFGTLQNMGEENYLLIDSEQGRACYALNRDRDIILEGPVGKSVVRIEGGQAFFLHSDCPEKLCTGMKPVSRGGEWAACMPNGIFISAGGIGEVDAAAY